MPVRKLVLVVLVIAWLSFTFAVGCGGDSLGRQPVSGAVNVDGAPLLKGSIRFQPVGKGIGSGASIEAGKYSIARKDGLPPGKYTVMINAPVPGSEAAPSASEAAGDAQPLKELIPEDWNQTSSHTIEITKSGKNEHNFEVKTKNK